MSENAYHRWLPWRSAALGWLVASAFLAVGLPLFLRMPLWCDATLYAVAAQTISSGGVHYRDVFDTNPPGFVWALCAVRGLLGTSGEALRVTDLLVVCLVSAALLGWARKAGASRTAIAWAAASIAAFYPFTHEFNHVQRDTWMMLPAVAALALRLKRTEEPNPPTPFPKKEGAGEDENVNAQRSALSPSLLRGGVGEGSLLLAFAEGVIWGVGCWIKPHLLFIAFAAWLVTLRKLRFRDSLAVFAGGLATGLAGVWWLHASGAWPHFVEIWKTWNADYLATVWRELPFRVTIQLGYFPPYSVCALLAVPCAVANLRSRSEEPEASRRKLLAAVYLAWLFTALLLQRPFHYVHVPETLLMLAVFAANRWPVPFGILVLHGVASVWFAVAGPSHSLVGHHVAFDTKRTQWWVQCFDREPSREARKGVAMWSQHFGGVDPVELGAVADYLHEQNIRDGELIAWHDSPHALYLDLRVKPGFRFMHVGTAAGLGKWQEQQVLRELQLAVPHTRFVVSDMHRVTEKYNALNDLDSAGLPKVLPAWQRKDFPWNQPVVFRSPGGRYLVHRVANPVTSARIPQELDEKEASKE